MIRETITCTNPECETEVYVPPDTIVVVCPKCQTPIEVNQDD